MLIAKAGLELAFRFGKGGVAGTTRQIVRNRFHREGHRRHNLSRRNHIRLCVFMSNDFLTGEAPLITTFSPR